MRTLLDEQFAPITSEIGFLRLPFDRVVAALTRWRGEQHPHLNVVELDEPLDLALPRLDPLEPGAPRELLVAHRGGWCAYLNSAPGGTDAAASIAHLSRTLRCDGVRVVTVPHSASRPGALRWEHTYRTDWSTEVRWVDLRYLDGRWTFTAGGYPQPYEEAVAYRAPRARDRLSSATLERYGQALGLELFDAAAYGPTAIWLEHPVRPAWATRLRRLIPQTSPGQPLAEVQQRLGIVPGAARDLPG